MLWEVDIYAADGQPDLAARDVAAAAAELHICGAGVSPANAAETAAPQGLAVTSARGYLIQGNLDRDQVVRIADGLLADRIVERTVAGKVGDPALSQLPQGQPHLIHVLPKPGVMDPVAQSAQEAITDFGLRAEAVRTLKKYAVGSLSKGQLSQLCFKVLANDAIEQVVIGPLSFEQLQVGSSYRVSVSDGAHPCDGRSGLGTAESPGATLLVAGRNADHPGPISHLGPRSHRH